MSMDPSVASVVRAQRFELVDADGVVRAQLSMSSLTGGNEPDDVVAGLELFGRPGHAVSLLAHRTGAQLSFEVGGNQVVIVEAFEDSSVRVGGSSITVCDRDGLPVVCWRVDPDGSVTCDISSRD